MKKTKLQIYKKQYREVHAEKIAAYQKQYRKDHAAELKISRELYKEKHPGKAVQWARNNHQKWLDFVGANKMKCQVCGYNKCFPALDMHHINPDEKEFTISNFLRKAFNETNKQLLLHELGKCMVLCCRCHREFHDLQRKLKDETERSKENQS